MSDSKSKPTGSEGVLTGDQVQGDSSVGNQQEGNLVARQSDQGAEPKGESKQNPKAKSKEEEAFGTEERLVASR